MAELEALAIKSRHKDDAQLRVALVDLDAGAGYLSEITDQANRAQSFVDFDVVFLPFPSGAIVSAKTSATFFALGSDVEDFPSVSRLYLPNLNGALRESPQQLGVDVVCCLTCNLIAPDRERSDLFSHRHLETADVRFISTYGVREYAKKAGVSFAKSILFLCLAEVLLQDRRWALDEHLETVGCLFDYCDNRDDLVVSLKHMQFDHTHCRQKIRDAQLLGAIDGLLKLPFDPKYVPVRLGAS